MYSIFFTIYMITIVDSIEFAAVDLKVTPIWLTLYFAFAFLIGTLSLIIQSPSTKTIGNVSKQVGIPGRNS